MVMVMLTVVIKKRIIINTFLHLSSFRSSVSQSFENLFKDWLMKYQLQMYHTFSDPIQSMGIFEFHFKSYSVDITFKPVYDKYGYYCENHQLVYLVD